MKPMLFVFAIFVVSGCSHLIIVKECNAVEGDGGLHVCRVMKPWD